MVLLDVEVALNNQPLSYLEDDIQLPTLTPNALLFGQPNTLPEIPTHHIDTQICGSGLNTCMSNRFDKGVPVRPEGEAQP